MAKLKKNDRELFVGIDPSYNGFAIIVMDTEFNIIEERLLKTKTKETIEERIISLEKEFSFILKLKNLKKVYFEGPSFSSSGAFMLEMGALNYYFRILLFKNNISYEIIPPTNLKKFVTGKGNVKKELMLLKTFKKWGVEFEDNNLCDAYCLCRYAIEEYNKNGQTN